MLTEGFNWQHFPGSGTLAVFYNPANGRPPALPYYKKTMGMKCGRLLISTGNNEFYQDCVDELYEIIRKISSGYEQTIHYGYSQGATGALDQGLRDSKCVAIFALSPHFVLQRPMSRSAGLMSPDRLATAQPNLLERIDANRNRNIYLFLSVHDIMDGIQVKDALTLSESPLLSRYFLRMGHYLEGVNDPRQVVDDYLENNCYVLPSRTPVATDEDIRLAMLAYDLLAATHTGANITNEVLTSLEFAVPCHATYSLARYLEAKGQFQRAINQYVRALGVPSSDLGTVLVCLGNAYVRMGWNDMALGCYRQALANNPQNEQAQKCEASLLRRIGHR